MDLCTSLQTYDRRLMRVYIWLYCVLGIFVPLAMLAVANCGLVKAVRRSTHLRRQFHVRNAHIDANERVTTVLATVVVAYITLVAPAEIVLFIERQLSDEGALAAGHLAVAIDVTNVMQTVYGHHTQRFDCQAFRASNNGHHHHVGLIMVLIYLR